MSASDWLSASYAGSDPLGLAAAAQAVQDNRTQLAQFAIAQAATAMSAGKNDEAISAFKKALAFDANNTSAYNYLGQLYLQKGDTSNAIKSYQQLVRIQSNPNSQDTSSSAPTLEAATLGLANSYLQAKQYTQSEQQFKAAALLDPQDPVPPYTLGQQYLTQGRLGEALTKFQQAGKLSPNDGNVFFAMGSVYNAQGNYSAAATALQTSIQLKPNFPSANYQLGIAYNGLNDQTDVQAQLTILNNTDSSLASQLTAAIKPTMVSFDLGNPANTFNPFLGPGSSLLVQSPSTLSTPNSSQMVSAVIQFSSNMDLDSITNPGNWTISMGNSSQSGYYNDMMPFTDKDATIPMEPVSVNYDGTSDEATVNFELDQNSTGDATIDPQHVVFTYKGQDAAGQSMDPNANAIYGGTDAGFSSSIDILA